MNPETCAVCRHIVEHDWTGLHAATHCRHCCAIWGGHNTIHCVTCHRTFSNDTGLRHHQTTYRDANNDLRVRCHDPATRTIGPNRRPYFGEPRPNAHGTLIWRRADPLGHSRRASMNQGDTHGAAT